VFATVHTNMTGADVRPGKKESLAASDGQVELNVKSGEEKKEEGEATVSSWSPFLLKKVLWVLVVFQFILFILFASCTKTGVIDPMDTVKNPLVGYFMFSGVEIMMFIGFGYLMTFMKWYGISAVGFTMIVTALGLQWSILTEAFFAMWEKGVWGNIGVDIYNLLNATYATSAVLISFGALIGKISPIQLIFITIVEFVVHSINAIMILGGAQVADLGGTFSDHMFGAYFGLAAAYMLGKPKQHEPVGGNYPDWFSLIGTLFLWVYWPSFVAGGAEAGSARQHQALVNTVLALSSSTITAFFLSAYLGSTGKFRPVDIQNATLAGGVSIGCCADLVHPATAIFIGIFGSSISTYGYHRIQPKLAAGGLHDTCGIHNLHGMPSLVGAIVSVFCTKKLWYRQFMGIFGTMYMAVSAGLLVGYLCRFLPGVQADGSDDFQDDVFWEVAGDYGGNADREKLKALELTAVQAAGHSGAGPAKVTESKHVDGHVEMLESKL
jgi:ammonium transporter Rh